MSTVPLGEICNVQIGRTPPRSDPRYWGGSNPWASISDLNQGLLITRTKEGITEEGAHAGKLVQPGTVLISFKLSIGKVSIAGIPLYTNEAIAALPIKYPSTLDARYLLRYLESLSLEEGANRAAMGRTLNKKTLSELPIPLPPLDEQRRIAAILDKADAIRQKQHQAIAHINVLSKPLLARALQSTSDRVLLGDLIKDGPKNGIYRPKSAYGAGVHIVRIDSFKFGSPKILTSSLKRLDLKSEEINEFALKDGDVLINRVNSKNYVGKTALVEDLQEQTVFESNMMRLRLDSQQIRGRFFAEFMQTLEVRRQLSSKIKDAINQSSINQQDVKTIEVPLPSIGAQDEFVSAINELESQRTTREISALRADAVFESLQSRAFRGEL